MTPMNIQVTRDAHGRLVLTTPEGAVHEGVVPVRAFPLSAPEGGLSLVGPDGRERLWVPRLADLPGPVQALLIEEIERREFGPVIEQLLEVSTFSTPSVWTVKTDRGATTLVLKAEEDIRRLPDGRGSLLITSGHGIVFRVRDLFALDRHSKKLIERFL